MQTISILNYTEMTNFLKDFLAISKKQNNKFSLRYHAQKLNWPTSLFTDVISKRRGLPIVKALELAKYLKLTDFEVEHLIQMAMTFNNNKVVSDYFKDILKAKHNKKEFPSSFETKTDLYQELELLAVYDYIKMKGILPSSKELIEELFTFNLTEHKVSQILHKLQINSILKINEQNIVEILKGPFLSDDKSEESTARGMLIHQKYAKNLIQFCHSPIRPFSLNSAFIAIKKEDYQLFLDHIFKFRNYIISKDLSEIEDNTQLYQFDINFFPISNK